MTQRLGAPCTMTDDCRAALHAHGCPHDLIPDPDPGACPHCGRWRRAGMAHDCFPEVFALLDKLAYGDPTNEDDDETL